MAVNDDRNATGTPLRQADLARLPDWNEESCATVSDVAPLLPRFIRFRSAPAFFGMNKNHFNQLIRPRLTAIRIGQQGLAFDRLEMEAAAEEYRRRNGVPVALSERSKPLWEDKRRRGSPEEGSTGISTSSSEERAFAKALERAICGKRRSTSPSE